jgi:hypothetical protein
LLHVSQAVRSGLRSFWLEWRRQDALTRNTEAAEWLARRPPWLGHIGHRLNQRIVHINRRIMGDYRMTTGFLTGKRPLVLRKRAQFFGIFRRIVRHLAGGRGRNPHIT